jgi:predicted transcriptional regulator
MSETISINIIKEWTDVHGDHKIIDGHFVVTPDIQTKLIAPLVGRLEALEKWHAEQQELTRRIYEAKPGLYGFVEGLAKPATEPFLGEAHQSEVEKAHQPAGDDAAVVQRIRDVAKEHGWAIGVHGSLRRDIDLIGAPWTADATDPDVLVGAIMRTIGYDGRGHKLGKPRPGGRRSILLMHPDATWKEGDDKKGWWTPKCIDLSLMPNDADLRAKLDEANHWRTCYNEQAKRNEAELNKALERVAELERQIVGEMKNADDKRAELDRALADLAAATSHERRMDAATQALMDEVTKLRSGLAAMTERAEKAEKGRSVEIQKRSAYLDSAMWERTSELNAAQAEADALRAEVEKAKGRKVKLPAKAGKDTLFTLNEKETWDAAIGSCERAIRAAGVEVEG